MRKFALIIVSIFFISFTSFSQTTYVPSFNFEDYLETHDANGNVVPLGDSNSMGNGIHNDDTVFTARIENVISLNVSSLNISTLTGIQDFSSLVYLDCGSNNLTNLDVLSLDYLETLYCRNNQISTLTLPNNNNSLLKISCRQNQLIAVDVSTYTNLTLLRFDDNSLTSLNVKNGNNSNVTTFNATGNPNLECIEVDNLTYSNTNWLDIDLHTNFSEDCTETTYVPDDNFEQVLIDLNLDNVLDDYVKTYSINSITSLNVSNKNISSLTGIEDFVSLTFLSCTENQLTTLDTSTLTHLETLFCRDNLLTNIDISNNLILEELSCRDNQIGFIDVQFLSNLTLLRADNNPPLYRINVKNGNNTIISTFNATNNPNLTCIQVDDEVYSTNNWTNVDATTSFGEHCFETYVPDDNFENFLETHILYSTESMSSIQPCEVGHPNSSGNGIANDNYVTTSKIDSLVWLWINNQNIADLTGIEDFAAMTVLSCDDNQLTNIIISNNLLRLTCSNNQLTNLDVSTYTNLYRLYCNNNQLTSLDVSTNTALERLYCYNNQLTSLDVSTNTNLKYFYCDDNQLTELNIKNGTNTIIINFDATNNPNLTCINVDDVLYSTNNWTNIDATTSFGEHCYETYVPDDSFEQALINLGYDTILDNYVFTQNIDSITSLSVYGRNITDLTGIEDFLALEVLYCYNNQLTSLDLSANTSLEILRCHQNQLASLTIGTDPNTTLLELHCDFNEFASLDVSSYKALTVFNCSHNLLTNIDVSTNTALQNFSCHHNQLLSLNLSANMALYNLECENNQLSFLNVQNGNNTNINNSHFRTTNNPNLTCIEVDDTAYSTSIWTNIDPWTSFNENCYTYIPDPNFEQALVDLGYDTLPLDTYVLTENINAVTNLDISNLAISNLTGIEGFIALEILNCSDNQFPEIVLTDNTALTHLYCNNIAGGINHMGISNNLNLQVLHCYNSSITTIDLNANTLLTQLYCQDNGLLNININNNTLLQEFNCANNAIFNLDLSLNTVLTEVNCAGNNVNLTELNIKNGENTIITNFDATNNPNLWCVKVDDENWSTINWTNIDTQTKFSETCNETFVPDDNFEQALIDLGYDDVLDDYVFTTHIDKITVIDLSNKWITNLTGIEDFIALEELFCGNNQLTNLDLSTNTVLQTLYCNSNQITSLGVSANINLTYLNAGHNNLESININGVLTLEKLYCDFNQLTSLDVSININLETLHCYDNQLTYLNVKNENNTNIINQDFNATNNPNLTCIEVDNPVWSTNNWTNIDALTSFGELCCNGVKETTWSGTWSDGNPTLNKPAIINANYDTSTLGNLETCACQINNGDTFTINNGDYLKVEKSFINNGTIIIEPTGSFVQVDDSASVTGSGTFTTKIETTTLVDQHRFTYFSSPVKNQDLSVFNTWANMNRLWRFNETTQSWYQVPETTIMDPAIGFAIQGNIDTGQYPLIGTANFNGTFNNGIYSYPLTYNVGGIDDDNALVGNPYPSAISALDLLTNNIEANAFYFWTHNSTFNGSVYASDDYAIWNNSGGIASDSGSPAPTGFIASGQGFFVDAIADGNFVFNNSLRVTDHNDDFRNITSSDSDRIWLNLNNHNGLFNQILLNFTENGTADFDAKLDATRYNTGNPISFYSYGINNERFAIQALPNLSNETIVPLGFEVIDETVAQLKIGIDHVDFQNEITVYLKDNLLQITHDLQLSDYEFFVQEIGIFNNRFELIFIRNSLNINDNLLANESLIVTNYLDDKIKVSTKNNSIIKNFKAYDVLGKLIMESKPNKSSFILDTNVNQGTILFIKVRLENGQILSNKSLKL